MKNLYALNGRRELIHISEVDKRVKDVYSCIHCGNELIARKGKQKAHHFAHKTVLDCNFETYLHKLGKLIFKETYNCCIDQGIPFFIEYEIKNTCSSCKEDKFLKRTCVFPSKVDKYDLTLMFDSVHLEKNYDGFIADVLLESIRPEINHKIFIEIAVSHSCEIQKIQSGIKIIEITLKEEGDVKILKENFFSLDNENLIFHNFGKPNDKKKKLNQCEENIKVFSVRKDKKAILRDVKAKNIYSILNDKKQFIYHKVLSNNNENKPLDGKTYINLVKEASHNGVEVKNCFACRFYTHNNNSSNNYQHFCKRLKTSFDNTNTGADCEKFWRIEKAIPS